MDDVLIPLEPLVFELDKIVDEQDGYRLVHVGRHQENKLTVPVEEFAMGSLPGPMILFELTVKSESGDLTKDEALELAKLCKEARDRLAGRPVADVWTPPAGRLH